MIITALFIRKGLRLLVQFMHKQYFVFINRIAHIVRGGGEKAIERHTSRGNT